MRISNFVARVAIGAALVIGVGGSVMQYLADEKHAADRESLIRRIDTDKLSPLRFQSRCGDPARRTIDGLQFVLFYDRSNVTVQYVAKDAKDFATRTFSTVHFWQSNPLGVMTLEQVVERLGCGMQ
jgi:hypothetical protein